MTQKKMLILDSDMEEQSLYIMKEGDEDRTLSQIILEMAERKETQGEEGRLYATKLRGKLGTHQLYIKSQEGTSRPISMDEKIGNINFSLESLKNESVYTVRMNLQRPYTGGA